LGNGMANFQRSAEMTKISPADEEAVLLQMERLLASSQFRNSRRYTDLLRYLVQQTLEGNADNLKERTLGIEVFGREPGFDTAGDSIVRVAAAEVRKRIAQYYQSDEARGSAVQIFIPPGAYRPTFAFEPGNNGASTETPHRDQPPTAASNAGEVRPEHKAVASSVPETVPGASRATRWRAWGIGVVAACAVLLAAWTAASNLRKSELQLFWGPFLGSKTPVKIYVGTVATYAPSINFFERNLSVVPDDQDRPGVMQSLPSLAEGQVLTANDVLVDQAVSIGDVKATAKVVAMLVAHHMSTDLRTGYDLPSEDFYNTPVVMIGALSNFWTTNLNPDLPFYFDRGDRIHEHGGQGRIWTIAHGKGRTVTGPGSTITEDYAIVARLLDSKTGAPVVALAGITSCGGLAASEFVTDPVRARKLQSISRDVLEHKNFEIVLHADIANCKPTSIEIIAERSW
jgi:hypothetical protein